MSEIHRLFQAAEREVKLAELDSGDLPTPAINELRYAGYHLLEGMVAAAPGRRDEQLNRAYRHCQRARYDAVEIRLWYYLGKFREFQEDYRAVVIPAVWADYLDETSLFDQAKELLGAVDKTEGGDNRGELLERTLEFCSRLAPIVAKLPAARDELNKQLEEQRKQERRDSRMFLVGVAGVMVAAISIIVPLMIGWLAAR